MRSTFCFCILLLSLRYLFSFLSSWQKEEQNASWSQPFAAFAPLAPLPELYTWAQRTMGALGAMVTVAPTSNRSWLKLHFTPRKVIVWNHQQHRDTFVSTITQDCYIAAAAFTKNPMLRHKRSISRSVSVRTLTTFAADLSWCPHPSSHRGRTILPASSAASDAASRWQQMFKQR